MMTYQVGYENGMTNFTLNFMEDLGWYKPNYYMAHRIKAGKDQGCKFIDEKCVKSING